MPAATSLKSDWRDTRASTALPLVALNKSASSVRLNPSIRNSPIGNSNSSVGAKEKMANVDADKNISRELWVGIEVGFR